MSGPRLRLLTGSSLRLRDETLTTLLAAHDGPVQRGEADRLDDLRMALGTPSLFGPPPLLVLRTDKAWLQANADGLLALLDEAGDGAALLVADAIDGRSALAKRLAELDAWLRVEGPGQRPQEIESWLVGRLHALGRPIERPQEVARALIAHRGADPDGLLSALDQVLDYADDQPLRATDVEAVVGGSATQKAWDLTESALQGDLARTLALAHAGEGLEVEQILAAFQGELRQLIACCATADDEQALAWAGREKVRYIPMPVRRRAQQLGAKTCARLLAGVAQAQRQARSGADAWLALEIFLFHARRVIRPGG